MVVSSETRWNGNIPGKEEGNKKPHSLGSGVKS